MPLHTFQSRVYRSFQSCATNQKNRFLLCSSKAWHKKTNLPRKFVTNKNEYWLIIPAYDVKYLPKKTLSAGRRDPPWPRSTRSQMLNCGAFVKLCQQIRVQKKLNMHNGTMFGTFFCMPEKNNVCSWWPINTQAFRIQICQKKIFQIEADSIANSTD